MAPRAAASDAVEIELDASARLRRQEDLQLSMKERLEELASLCRQLSEIAGVARRDE